MSQLGILKSERFEHQTASKGTNGLGRTRRLTWGSNGVEQNPRTLPCPSTACPPPESVKAVAFAMSTVSTRNTSLAMATVASLRIDLLRLAWSPTDVVVAGAGNDRDPTASSSWSTTDSRAGSMASCCSRAVRMLLSLKQACAKYLDY